MILIIGLGNPGKEYEKTRHNLGFMVVEKMAKDLATEQLRIGEWEMKKKLKARVLKHREIILAEPQAFMNNSGFVVKSLITNYSITQLLNLWVIHDDLDLPLRKIRIQIGGGAAGHHGVESIIEALGTKEFTRFRMGIGYDKQNAKCQMSNVKSAEDYVLGEFRKDERPAAEKMIARAAEAIQFALKEGIEKAMGKFNG